MNSYGVALGDETMMAYDDLFAEADVLPTREQIEQLSSAMPFKRGLIQQIQRQGFTGDPDNQEEVLGFLRQCCEEAGVSILEETLRNWLKGKQPAPREDKRENIYKVCFALNMTASEAKGFFLKAFFSRPFNYKSIYEATCFFCLNTGRSYADVLRLEQMIKEVDAHIPSDFEVTEEIGQVLSDITEEDAFVRFMTENRAVFDEQTQTAAKRVNVLLQQCYHIANQYCERFLHHEAHKKITSSDSLLNLIYGYAARSTEDGKKTYLKSVSKSNFPAMIRVNFPQRQQIRNISNGTASYDVLRKALIMFYFFHFFAQHQLEGETVLMFSMSLNMV